LNKYTNIKTGTIIMKKNYRSLSEFIHELEQENELIRFKEPVSNRLEITEITDRMSKLPEGGKAILFENVEGYEYPLLINQFGRACGQAPGYYKHKTTENIYG